MSEQQQSLQELQHIKQMMERSSRFISLSGLSGVMAGLCALVGAYFAYGIIHHNNGVPVISRVNSQDYETGVTGGLPDSKLFQIAILTLLAAVFLAFIFTYLRSKKNGVAVWGSTSKRLLGALAVPMIAGGIYLLREIQVGNYGMIAPGCLIFYGLALVNASRYTFGEVKYLGYFQVLLGIINLWMMGYGLFFWAIGFGVLHIIYGIVMWYRYERN